MSPSPAYCATGSCRATPEGGSCCPACVAPLTSPQERLAALRAVLADEPEPLVSLTHLLRLCRDEHRLLWERVGDPEYLHRLDPVLAALRAQPGGPVLNAEVRRLLAAAFDPAGGVPAVVVAHRLAGFLDERYGPSLAASFRRRSPYQPAVGDPVPLDSPDLRTVTAMRPISPPWRLANRLDETRRVRLAGEWAVRFRVVFDYGLADTLTGLITADTVVATCHPNRELAEFDLSRTAGGGTFPVRPVDVDRQRAQIDRLLHRATAAGASIVVLPELAVTEALAAGLHDWVRRPGGPRLLVAGSYHHADPPGPDPVRPRRRNSAVCWVRGHDRPLIQDKHSPGDRPIREDIQPPAWPEVRVYVTADGWHLAVAICRDLLNPQAVYALAEAGVNLVLVPAMSETLMPFGAPAAQLVGSHQALVVVANNPAVWSDHPPDRAARPARALFGHPGFGQQTRFVHSPDPAPGVALLTVGSAQLTWHPDDPAATTRPVPAPGGRADAALSARPAWLRPLAARTADPASPLITARQPVAWRPAAVLVLVTDGPAGPHVLLTERAGDLTDYPGRLTFPGGRVEPGDGGPVDAALREAAEEVGLDPGSVEVVGLLPSFALPDSGFMVTPVLAWSPRPGFTGAVNIAEVTALWDLPLSERRAAPGPAGAGAGTDGRTPDDCRPDLAALGPMTAAVIDLLTGILGSAGNPRDATRSDGRCEPGPDIGEMHGMNGASGDGRR